MSGTDSPILRRPIEVLETLGAVTYSDTWLGKRKHRRVDLVLPVRLGPLGEHGKPHGPAFTARLRDVSADGFGVTVPYDLELNQQFQVELFTEVGTLVGRMRTMHCTQTIGAYKVGMRWLGPLPDQDRLTRCVDDCSPAPSLAPSEKSRSEVLTLEQARDEIRQSMRKYFVSAISHGLLGISMEKEVARLMDSLPRPGETDVCPEPRRQNRRYQVQGAVHLVIVTDEAQELSNHEIVDISSGGTGITVITGTRVHTGEPDIDRRFDLAVLRPDKPVVVGLWVEPRGTLWLPARVVYCAGSEQQCTHAGLQFSKEDAFRQFR